MNIFEREESYEGKNADKNIHNMQTYIPILIFQNLKWEKKENNQVEGCNPVTMSALFVGH